MKQARKASRPSIKCSQYLKPVSVSVSACLSIRNFHCLTVNGANHYQDTYNKDSYCSTILLRVLLEVTILFSHIFSSGIDKPPWKYLSYLSDNHKAGELIRHCPSTLHAPIPVVLLLHRPVRAPVCASHTCNHHFYI